MKICVITHTMPRFKEDTNSASFISELAESLSKQGHEVFVLAPYDPLIQSFNRPFKVINYKYIWPNALHISGYSRVLKGDKKIKPQMYLVSILMSISALLHLVVLSRKYNFDIVSAHWAIPNGFIAFLASLITKVPYTVTIPGSDVFLASKNEIFKFAMEKAVMRAAWVISDSQHYLKALNNLAIIPTKTAVIRYGVNTNQLRPQIKNAKIIKQFNVSPKDRIILCLGRFVEKKGFMYVIDAMPRILKSVPNTSLLLIGDGELKSEFNQRISELKIKEKVILPGAVPYSKRADYYNLADVFVMPSIKDSKGNIDASPVAMMDAMACGVAVVATKYSGSPDLIAAGKTGFIVRERSSSEIANAVLNLLRKKDKKNIRQEVRQTAVSNFSLEQTAQKYTKIFATIVKQ